MNCECGLLKPYRTNSPQRHPARWEVANGRLLYYTAGEGGGGVDCGESDCRHVTSNNSKKLKTQNKLIDM